MQFVYNNSLGSNYFANLNKGSVTEDDFLYLLALKFTSRIGDVNAKVLVDTFGSAKGIFSASTSELLSVEGIGKQTAKAIHSNEGMREAETELENIRKHNLSYLTFWDEDFPKRLKQCADAPLFLFYQGNKPPKTRKYISIVGTRKCTSYGEKMTRLLVEELAPYNPVIISGLAYGIDYFAHETAVHHNIPTFGILGHGFHTLYPITHSKLAKRMCDKGGLLTEFMYGSKFEKENFPKRNRIVAGMSEATVIVESAKKGGAVITALLADGYHRDILCFPGRSGDDKSEGCNRLIKSHKAHLIESAEDLVYVLGWKKISPEKKEQQMKLFLQLSNEEKKIVNLLEENDILTIEQISIMLNEKPSSISLWLLNLEMENVIKNLPGDRITLK